VFRRLHSTVELPFINFVKGMFTVAIFAADVVAIPRMAIWKLLWHAVRMGGSGTGIHAGFTFVMERNPSIVNNSEMKTSD
jgi:hypothetical protein